MSRDNLYISSSEEDSHRENLKFVIKLILFAAMVMVYFLHIMPQYSQSYAASLIDKVERLTSIDSPKIVLLGNSNVVFGINSGMIEREFKMPVVNMGLQEGVGDVFHQDMAKYNVTEGDIYIICHSLFAGTGDYAHRWMVIEDHFLLWKLLRPSDIYPMMKAYPTYLKRCLDHYVMNTGNVAASPIYSRNAINEYGDGEYERKESMYTFVDPVVPPKISAVTIEEINKLNNWLENRGATLLVAGYPIGDGELTADKKEFIDFQKELEEQLDCPVISQYTDYMFDYSYFYDSSYHLTNEGARLRTEQLIADIKKWQDHEKNIAE